jgi:hypothetical protein
VTSPPLGQLIAYRLFGWRLGPLHREWTYDDITRPGYTLRQAVPVGLAIGLVLGVAFASTGANPVRAAAPTAAVIALSFLLRNQLRRRALTQQGLTPEGEPQASWYDDERERHRRNVGSASTTGFVVIAGLLLLGVGRR